MGTCNILNDLSNRVCISNKFERTSLVQNIIWNPDTCSCKNGKYLGSIIDDWIITCDEVINAAENKLKYVMSTLSINFHNKKGI